MMRTINEFAGVVTTEGDRREVESLPLTTLGDFVRGRISAFEPRESTWQVEGLFESLLAEAFEA
jgi:hypothetical protein